MNFRNNLTAFSWKPLQPTRRISSLGGEGRRMVRLRGTRDF